MEDASGIGGKTLRWETEVSRILALVGAAAGYGALKRRRMQVYCCLSVNKSRAGKGGAVKQERGAALRLRGKLRTGLCGARMAIPRRM